MDTRVSNYSPSMRSSARQHLISFRPMSCLRPFSREMVRKCDDGGGPFYHQKLNLHEFDEPASPRVGCMGQIKRDKVGSTCSKGPKFCKLKKMLPAGKKSGTKFDGGGYRAELDPPLPVPESVSKECNAVSLWKRRSGQPLECLQLQPQPEPQQRQRWQRPHPQRQQQ